MRRVVLGLAVLALAVPGAAVGSSSPRLAELLGRWWTTVLAVPRDHNPVTGHADPCLRLGNDIVAPLGGFDPPITCVVKPGAKIFVFGLVFECSSVEPPPFHGESYEAQVACARGFASTVSGVRFTVDGRPIAAREVTTPPGTVTLPAENLLRVAAGPATFAADGWVALQQGLRPGTHTFTTHEEIGQSEGPPRPIDETFRVQVGPPDHRR